MSTGSYLPVPGDPGISFIEASFESARSQFAPILSEMASCQAGGQPVPTGLLQNAAAFLGEQEQRFSPAGGIATELASRGQLSAAAANWLDAYARDFAQARAVYEQMAASNATALKDRWDYINQINQQNAAAEMNQMKLDEQRMDQDAQKWWAPNWY